MGELFLLLGLMLAGAIGAFFAGKLPMSSVAAVALTLVPVAGFGLTRVFC